MMKSRIPVTVTNVACELFNEAYNKAIKGLYHIKYDCFEDGQNYSAYVWAKQSSCDQPAEVDCLVKNISRTYEPCDRTASSYTCDISTTITVGQSACTAISITTSIL